MKIVILSQWFSDKMGYAENNLPVAFGKLGHEVHLITTDLQVYATSANYESVYQQHLGPKQVDQGIFKKKQFTLHRNPHTLLNGLAISNLEEKLKSIQPDIVYCFEIFEADTLLAAALKNKYGYKLFCESRMHISVFKPASNLFQLIKTFLKGRSLSKQINRFYPIAQDVLFIINKYYGIPKNKCQIASLAVDTETFTISNKLEEKKKFRERFGFADTDIVCIYTGRLTKEKGSLILAKAINHLHELGDTKFKGLFVGQGNEEYKNEILHFRGCQIKNFVNVNQLPQFYQSFDIGVWPLQESTSQLDAAACGMPIIINDMVQDNFRTEGNGLTYKNGNYRDLAQKIKTLESKEKRTAMGKIGHHKITESYSWDFIAKKRMTDFRNL